MRRAGSLRVRVIASGLVVVALVLCLVGALLFVALRAALVSDAEELLASRTELVRVLAERAAPAELATALAERGVPAVVRSPGTAAAVESEPASRGAVLTEVVDLPGGGQVEVFVSLAATDSTLRDVGRGLVLGVAFGLVLAALLLVRVSRVALEPLDDMVATAQGIARGEVAARLGYSSTSEIGRLAGALDEMLDTLEAAVDEARSANAATERFLADAAHQLRTPLTGIQASAELLVRSDVAPDDASRLLANMVGECGRMGRLITALLRLASIDLHELPPPGSGDLAMLCREEVERAAALVPGVAINLTVEDPPPRPIDLDAGSMSEALSNILENGCRHAVDRVDVSVTSAGDSVEVRITDDGHGMDRDTADRAFERFASLDHCGGAGLGLPIARGVVEAHGGTLDYERGAFVLRLPRERRSRSRPHAGATAVPV